MSISRSSQSLKVNAEEGCLCLCGLKFKRRKDDTRPGHLHNWELWMQKRKQIHKLLAENLKCDPGDLLMNTGDILRNIKEEKLILEYTKIQNHFDKYRGNPNFWKLPHSLKNKCPPYEGTEYFLVRTKEENNEVPTIEYVGVPDYILEEKNVIPRTRHLKNLWHKSSYREQVLERVSEKLLEIEPHKPDLSNLIILGSNFAPDKPVSSLVNVAPSRKSNVSKEITSTKSVEDQESAVYVPVFPDKHPKTLKVNHKEFNEYCDLKENKISIMFQYFTGSILPCQESIEFENTGEVTLRLYWKQYKKLKIFREYTDNTTIFHPFKFDKNEIILLPGMKITFPIWFQVARPGNYIEYWELTSLPKIWTSDLRLIIVLKGFAFIKNYEERVQQLSEKLRQMARSTTIKDVLSGVISRGTYCAETTTHSLEFSEEEFFESVNLIKNMGIQTPKYIYNPVIIGELKKFYEEVRLPGDPEQWNLAIKVLREIARKKDLFSYFEAKLILYDTAKLKRTYLKENSVEVQNKSGVKKEKETSKKQTEKARKELAPEPEENTPTITYFAKLNNILRKLEKPSIYTNKERKKYLFSWIIIKTLFWKMFEQLDALNDNVTEVPTDKEINQEALKIKQHISVPDRLLYETFDETYILRTKRISQLSGTLNAKPKSLLLKGILNSDIKKVFKTYFNKDEVTQKGAKGKVQIQEIKKTAKEQKNKGKANQDEDLYLDVTEYFNPFSESYTLKSETTATLDLSDINLTPLKPINEDKYLIVYETLCQAVDALVDTLEAFNGINISSDTLGELQKCNVALNKTYYETPIEQTSIETLDSTIPEKKSSKESVTDPQSDYFKYLQELHWDNNSNTKKYFVDEEQKTSSYNIDGRISEHGELKVDSDIKQSVMNIFSLEDFRPKIEPYGLKECATQTEHLDSQNLSSQSVSKTSSIQSAEGSKNIFYFLRNMDDKGSNITMMTND